jgi:hypothetical protein
MTTILTVLRAGKDFAPKHVQWLARQVPDLRCLSDQPVTGVPTHALRRTWPGWWAKMEAFDVDMIPGDVLLMDLDTVVFDLPAMPGQTTVLPDFYRPALMGSGVMFLTEADRSRCFDAFARDPKRHMRECTTRAKWGDQGFLAQHIGQAPRWGAEVRSFKVHCRSGVPAGTKVVCFHGQPRPWDSGAEWVPSLQPEVVAA